MPHASPLLTSFQRRDTLDKLMMGYVMGMQDALPSVSVEKALANFARRMRLPSDLFDVRGQRSRYERLLRDFFDDQKTPENGTEDGS